jgi:UDP-N-acetylmuramoylalanine--D-glutamate ligase
MTRSQKYFGEMKSKRVAFIGVGVSHLELIKLFLSKGIKVVICDKKSKDEFDEGIYEEFNARGVDFSLGENYIDEIYNCDVVFRTPGFYYNIRVPDIKYFQYNP